MAEQCEVVVVACNTASAAALAYLRARFPHTPFIGMEPAIKPAASATRSGKIAVLATRGTLEGKLFSRTRAHYARDVQVQTVYPTDWVERVERGDIDSPETLASVRAVIEPLLEAGVDEIALGCTHYPFLIPVIQAVAGGRATVLDPSEAVARQTARVAPRHPARQAGAAHAQFYTSGDANEFARVASKLLQMQNTLVFRSDI